MTRLTDRKWKEFMFQRLFSVERGKPLYKQYMNKGNIPYVSATSLNNGISDYTDTANRSGNLISLAYDGSVGSTFYQPSNWFASEKIVSIDLIDTPMNVNNALFLSRVIENQKIKYSYGYKWSVGIRMMKGKVILPVDDEENPDYAFMEKYIQELKEKKQQSYEEFVHVQLSELGQIINIPDINELTWKPYFVKSIFETPLRGKRIIEKNHIVGSVPLVSSYGQQNGVTNFIGNEDNVRKFKNCLSIANGGSSAGKVFYHPYTFIAADHVTQCWNKNLNKYQYLFLATVMTKALSGKYSFSHEISDTRLEKEKIMLPSTESEEPDYEYMEQYIKNLMIKKYQSYLSYMGEM